MEIEIESVIKTLRDMKDHFLEMNRIEREFSESVECESSKKEMRIFRSHRALGAAEGLSLAIARFEGIMPRPRHFGGDAA